MADFRFDESKSFVESFERLSGGPSLKAVLTAPYRKLTLPQYQYLSRGTDQKPEGLSFPLLGLFGEAGSLLSELKKKQRDADSYFGYETSVIEEMGDVFWYFANIATRPRIDLSVLARKIRGGRAGGETPDILISSLQPSLSAKGSAAEAAFEATLMRLAGEIGKLAADFSANGVAASFNPIGFCPCAIPISYFPTKNRLKNRRLRATSQ